MGKAAAAEKAEQVEFALGAHLVQRLVVGEIDDLNDESLRTVGESGLEGAS